MSVGVGRRTFFFGIFAPLLPEACIAKFIICECHLSCACPRSRIAVLFLNRMCVRVSLLPVLAGTLCSRPRCSRRTWAPPPSSSENSSAASSVTSRPQKPQCLPPWKLQTRAQKRYRSVLEFQKGGYFFSLLCPFFLASWLEQNLGEFFIVFFLFQFFL